MLIWLPFSGADATPGESHGWQRGLPNKNADSRTKTHHSQNLDIQYLHAKSIPLLILRKFSSPSASDHSNKPSESIRSFSLASILLDDGIRHGNVCS
jgi:hypothetical protein